MSRKPTRTSATGTGPWGSPRFPLREISLIVVGSIVSAAGIVVAINSGHGQGTLAVLWKGFSLMLGITIGQASLLIAAVMVAVSFAIDRSQIRLGTILYQLIYSSFVDVFNHGLHVLDPSWLGAATMVGGVFVFAVGTGMCAAANWGRGSYEALTFALVEVSGFSIRAVRIALDAFSVVAGSLLGGSAGWCTVVMLLMSGPVIQWTVKSLDWLHLRRLREKGVGSGDKGVGPGARL